MWSHSVLISVPMHCWQLRLFPCSGWHAGLCESVAAEGWGQTGVSAMAGERLKTVQWEFCGIGVVQAASYHPIGEALERHHPMGSIKGHYRRSFEDLIRGDCDWEFYFCALRMGTNHCTCDVGSFGLMEQSPMWRESPVLLTNCLVVIGPCAQWMVNFCALYRTCK